MDTDIPIIDIFAGPGGLGEGFTAFKPENDPSRFRIKLSIEKDETAHQTLELRAFYRQFVGRTIPPEYYDHLRGAITREQLFEKYECEAGVAKKEAWKATLGEDRELIKTRITEAVQGASDWVLIGGPPCQAYSLVGRSKMRGLSKWKYARDKRHTLYKEYLRILADHQPTVFVMENVKGLLSSRRVQKQKTFELIINDLKSPLGVDRKGSGEPLHYKLFSVSKSRVNASDDLKPGDFVVRAEEYGIPQARHRIFILGIRSDKYKSEPEILEKIEHQVPIEGVIGDLPKLRSGLSKEADSAKKWSDAVKSVTKAGRLNSVDQSLRKAIISAAKKVSENLERGEAFSPQLIVAPQKYSEWYVDNGLSGICNHETRSHIKEDLYRYFFAAVFAQVNKKSPTLNDFPNKLLPDHENVEEALVGSKFNDRFRVQVRGKPSTTVVSHISKDGHYYIHYDPAQCRSLTVREAARLQTFPDNYFFEGNRTQQYHQVGNAVPPLLANKIAEIVYKVLKNLQ
jgi:DNA (cytosine-5)-methyltransferase 1